MDEERGFEGFEAIEKRITESECNYRDNVIHLRNILEGMCHVTRECHFCRWASSEKGFGVETCSLCKDDYFVCINCGGYIKTLAEYYCRYCVSTNAEKERSKKRMFEEVQVTTSDSVRDENPTKKMKVVTNETYQASLRTHLNRPEPPQSRIYFPLNDEEDIYDDESS
jgi:hypothetical protein